MKIHHIGYLVHDINESLPEMLKMGYQQEQPPVKDEDRGINIVFLSNNGVLIELISPYRDDSAVSNLLRKKGEGPYHICYECDDIGAKAAELSESFHKLIQPPATAIALGNRRVCFLYHSGIGITELLEQE